MSNFSDPIAFADIRRDALTVPCPYCPADPGDHADMALDRAVAFAIYWAGRHEHPVYRPHRRM